MYDSHLSLRDDFEVSRPELDAFAVALVARTETDALEVSARHRFEDEDFEEPEFCESRPVAGRRLPVSSFASRSSLNGVLGAGSCLAASVVGYQGGAVSNSLIRRLMWPTSYRDAR